MRPGDPFLLLAIVIIGAIAIAFPLAILINRLSIRRRNRAIWKAISRPSTPHELRNEATLHEFVSRSERVDTHKSAPNTAGRST